jgi:thymidylate kinase
MRRLIRPPGPFIIFEGVDGVGKSTIIREIVPLLEEITGLGGTVEFHWKPCAKSIRTTNEPPPSQNPRGKPARGKTASLLFLAYHWLGFWLGWLRWVYPSLTRSISVVGDRYATDLYLDPLRFRLSLPDWILFWAAQSVPKGIVIALVADPQIVTDRKHELTHAEISEYQQRLDHLAKRDKSVFIVNANGAPATIVAEVRNSILKCLERKTQQRL